MRSAPRPAECAFRALQLATAPDYPGLQRRGVVALGFLVFARPTSLHFLCRFHLRFAAAEFTLQLVTFKYGESGSSPQIALRIPFPATADPVSPPPPLPCSGCHHARPIPVPSPLRISAHICRRSSLRSDRTGCRLTSPRWNQVHRAVSPPRGNLRCLRSDRLTRDDHASVAPYLL